MLGVSNFFRIFANFNDMAFLALFRNRQSIHEKLVSILGISDSSRPIVLTIFLAWSQINGNTQWIRDIATEIGRPQLGASRVVWVCYFLGISSILFLLKKWANVSILLSSTFWWRWKAFWFIFKWRVHSNILWNILSASLDCFLRFYSFQSIREELARFLFNWAKFLIPSILDAYVW